jgi:anion-transporting  ArsA/GET3 family ATPase
VIFVAGKGGTGKSTLAAALGLLAARAGKRVLCVEVDLKGDLARLLGLRKAGFEPRLAQAASPNLRVLALDPEESLQEYLAIYFKVPRLVRLTPLARMFDFVAGGVPGIREMLVSGKIAWEERKRDGGRPLWDLIVVDGAATGQLLPQLSAARLLGEMARGGLVASQTRWVEETLSDPARTLMAVCALPEEMPVVEAVELAERARAEAGMAVGACFLNRSFTKRVSEERIGSLEGAPPALLAGLRLAATLHAETRRQAGELRRRLGVPVVEVPILPGAAPSLETASAVAAALEASPA